MPDGSAGFVYVRDTRFASMLDEAGAQPIIWFWLPPGWPEVVNSRGTEPNVMVVRQALLEHGRQSSGQVRSVTIAACWSTWHHEVGVRIYGRISARYYGRVIPTSNNGFTERGNVPEGSSALDRPVHHSHAATRVGLREKKRTALLAAPLAALEVIPKIAEVLTTTAGRSVTQPAPAGCH